MMLISSVATCCLFDFNAVIKLVDPILATGSLPCYQLTEKLIYILCQNGNSLFTSYKLCDG